MKIMLMLGHPIKLIHWSGMVRTNVEVAEKSSFQVYEIT